MSDNGGNEPEKLSKEELAIRKRKAFEANPDEFIHISELVIGTRVFGNGFIQCIVGVPNQLLIEQSLGRIQHEGVKVLCMIEAEKVKQWNQRTKKKIIQPGHGIMDFVRGGK